jgi:hypothetical protein
VLKWYSHVQTTGQEKIPEVTCAWARIREQWGIVTSHPKSVPCKTIERKIIIHFRGLYLLEHMGWRLPYSGRARSESEDWVVPSSSEIFGRSFPIVITAVIRPDSNRCHGPVSFPLLFHSFHILTLSVRIFFSHSCNFFRYQIHLPLQRPTTRTLLSRT